ncbi:MAG TPA: glycine betaine ABC transporter substrate-binding protein [Thermoanaerobaculia bacterium]|nr:glycine betaine ABC transporter substrate-binding protein [Thermoanaerobaculia bacterium]
MNIGARRRACLMPALGLLGWGLASSIGAATDGTVVVGSKNFAESRFLGELFAQAIEAQTSLRVERRLGLAGTEFCFEALRTGAIDVYPEYTGTGWVTLLRAEAIADQAGVLAGVRREFRERWDLEWLAPLGFENSWEIAVRREVAERYSLRTISQLAAVAGDLRAGFGLEFVAREDGLEGLRRVYGLEPGSVRALQQTPQYQAAREGIIDVVDVYTTDGRLAAADLVLLEDDRGFFPPYQAAPLARGVTLREHPEMAAALGRLAGALDVARMREYNRRLEELHEPLELVAADALRDLGLAGGSDADAEAARQYADGAREGFAAYVWRERVALGRRTLEHLGLSAAALLLGAAVAIPLALWLDRRGGRVAESVVRFVGATQTVPSLALLGFLIPLLGVGVKPAIAALWIYAIFPMLRSATSGLRDADPAAALAATALGMTEGQVLRRVRLPLALPAIMAGVRTAAAITIGTATLAAFIGAGGLGEPIIAGLQLVDTKRILSGAVPAALLALLVDWVLGRVERALRPPGVSG